ncbi:hypothetical protein MLD38_020900 [Melastoma candidum]|uniref:Uncharacterized protein n=1 Tax=Melastoma candidum TaxID=119954 RepID=A0ACB9QI80_9MYRT|nr:hypothetical protein MLD38_020900 [Melastoma candidum]
MSKTQENAFSIISTLLYVLLRLSIATSASPLNATALFVFGDSTVDPGNNIHIPTNARADHPPYGRNLPDHKPLGRYTNGKLATDFLSSRLGLKELLPPYLDPTLSDDELISGVSFASAAMGLDEMTCLRSKVMNISTQLGYFDEAVSRITKKLGSREASRIVGDAIYLVSAGTNDMLVNMYDLPTRRVDYTVSQYEDVLLQKVQSIIEVHPNLLSLVVSTSVL